MDKWVPTTCLILSVLLASTAYFLWSTKTSDASDTIIEQALEKEIVIEQKEIPKKRILIVPGHDPVDYGAEFKDLKEEKINLELAQILYNLLKQEDSFEVFVTRDENGYTNDFVSFFNQKREEIYEFINQHKEQTEKLILAGEYEPVIVVEHKNVSKDIAFKLYGINHWINENEIDLVLHIHFNDYPRKDRSIIGKYNGYSIYIPSENLVGHQISKEVAEKIEENLSVFFQPSNLPIEKDIIIENSELIAVGSNKTLEKTPSVLVEYGYIYEPQFYNEEEREESLEKSAYQTFLAIKESFN